MANESSEQVLIGANGQVYVAETTADAPTGPLQALDTDFVELGYVSEEGATITDAKTLTNIGAWQSFYPVRRVIADRDFTVRFALRQWNADTLAFALGGGTWDNASGSGQMFTPPSPDDIDERSIVIDWQDGSKHYRLYCPKGLVTENVETTLSRTAAADLPITFGATPATGSSPYFIFTDDSAFGS